ncbi:CLUMA_CG017615, isoform A [Clunio marinus]|uniref:CLUMA_CG017615, isoform A n=1 Tax=Clunio marinus TaxID=568069 RepID=A0A1J1IZE6_9DIPT|nr:CLUMA_CG017615, isoform A [Clunio marinus]
MKGILLIVIVAAVNCALSEDEKRKHDWQIWKYHYKHLPNGGYKYEYYTYDYKHGKETGGFETIGDKQVFVVEGYCTYVANGNTYITVRYRADDKGFHPTISNNYNGGFGSSAPSMTDISDHARLSLVGG